MANPQFHHRPENVRLEVGRQLPLQQLIDGSSQQVSVAQASEPNGQGVDAEAKPTADRALFVIVECAQPEASRASALPAVGAEIRWVEADALRLGLRRVGPADLFRHSQEGHDEAALLRGGRRLIECIERFDVIGAMH